MQPSIGQMPAMSNSGSYLTTGFVSSQVHVVYNGWFETVTADADWTPPEWKEPVKYFCFQNVLNTDFDPLHLDDDWLDNITRKASTADEALHR
jgi:hypothetical protein